MIGMANYIQQNATVGICMHRGLNQIINLSFFIFSLLYTEVRRLTKHKIMLSIKLLLKIIGLIKKSLILYLRIIRY